ncbi:MAG: hypothetical protein JNK82_01945 [Myxococcaceae bacterium]|nr:hypothetical protein [Myxococcaceae bacterium]
MSKRLLSVVAVLIAASAGADAPPKPNGIKIGDGRLHPFLAVRAAYDSAAGFFPAASGGEEIRGDFIITPSLGLAFALDTPSTAVNFRGQGGFAWYTGLVTPSATPMSYVNALVGLDTAFNKTGAVEVQIGDTFSRTNATANLASSIGVISLFNSAYLAVPIHPGGGAITVTPRVRWDVEFFSPQLPSRGLSGCNPNDIRCNPNLVQEMNYSNLNASLGGRWKFLPKTAVVADVQFDHRTYFNTSDPTPPAPGTPAPTAGANLTSYILRGTAGLSGLITSRLSVLALIGGAGDFGLGRGASPLAQAEVAYLGSDLTLRGGYLLAMNPVPVYGTVGQHRGYAEFRATFFGRLTARLFGAFDYIDFPVINDTVMGTTRLVDRNDYFVTVQSEIAVQIISILSVSVSYNLSWRIPGNGAPVGNQYVRHEPALNVMLSY